VSSVQFEIFDGLPHDVIANIIRDLPSRTYAAGDVLLRENEPNNRVFLIELGELGVWKGTPNTTEGVCVARLKPGLCFGEMSALNSTPSSATIVAESPATVRLMALTDLPVHGNLRETVTLNLARTLVERLSLANEAIEVKHQQELKAMRVMAAAAAFITRMLVALTCYMFSLPFFVALTPLLPSNSLISFFFIVTFGWVVLNFMNQWPEVRSQHWYMTLAQWPRQIARGLLWTIPPLLVFLIIKLSFMQARPGQYEFFEPMRAISPSAAMNYPLWLGFALVYTALCFAQEFIRCAVQGTLAMINTASSMGGPWKAILLSDVVFASIHMHLGPAFAAQAFIGGLFFGYEFYRERSYLAVATSHSIVGVWAVFIVGIPT
jgi:CRP-like cAMP-binding protein